MKGLGSLTAIIGLCSTVLSSEAMSVIAPRLLKPRKLPNITKGQSAEMNAWNAEVESRKRLKRERKGIK